MSELAPPASRPAPAATAAPPKTSAGWLAVLAIAPVIIVVVTVAQMGRIGYHELDRGYPGLETSYVSALLRLVVDAASTLCLGSLAMAVFVTPRADRTFLSNHRDFAITRWSSAVWALGATALIAVDAADTGGQSLSRLLVPGALSYLVQANYLPGAWILAAVVAVIIFCMANVASRWVSGLAMFVFAAVAVLAPVLVTQVLVGPGHDFGGDAAMFGTPATAIWIGATFSLVLRWHRRGKPGPITLRRYRVLSSVCWAIFLGSSIIDFFFETQGGAPLASLTGILFAVKVLGVSLVYGAAVVATRAWHPQAVPARRGLAWTVVLLSAQALYVGVDVAMTRIPPPQYFVPTSIEQLFLGYNVPAALSVRTLLLGGRINILFVTLAVVFTFAYLAAVITLRRRGDAWPAGRTAAWILGWVTIVATTSLGVGPYASVSFSVHMAFHMSMNMLGPLLLCLGGVTTLFLRATTAHRAGQAAGPHEWLVTLLHSRLLSAGFNPIYVFLIFIGSYYAIYFTPIYEQAMRYHWAHQALNLHFVVIGYMFYALVVGVDPPPRPLPHIGKLGLVLAAMPFHAFFGVIVMTSHTVIAQTYFQYLRVPWMPSLLHDQYVGGGIAWAAGEVPLVVVVLALVTQWSRQDSRLAKRTDRHLDSGMDDSFTDYNTMLARLANRETDARSTTPEDAP